MAIKFVIVNMFAHFDSVQSLPENRPGPPDLQLKNVAGL